MDDLIKPSIKFQFQTVSFETVSKFFSSPHVINQRDAPKFHHIHQIFSQPKSQPSISFDSQRKISQPKIIKYNIYGSRSICTTRRSSSIQPAAKMLVELSQSQDSAAGNITSTRQPPRPSRSSRPWPSLSSSPTATLSSSLPAPPSTARLSVNTPLSSLRWPSTPSSQPLSLEETKKWKRIST
jgi:hypothetical protein